VIDGQTVLALWALLAFQAKHLLCDFVLQTKFQAANKGYYGHVGGILHAGCHALFTVPVLLILTRSVPVIAVIAACEFAVHYHVDWIKARTERTRNWNSTDTIYWVAFGGDQFLHQVTYIVIVALLLRVTPI
jgi:Protein of unknown function (DUF3307)